jgi:TonB family protein
METLATTESASPDTEREFNLLLVRDRKDDWPRWRKAGIVSLCAHAVLILVLLLMPESATVLPVYESQPVRLITPLYIPTELTQKDQNKGKLSKELSVAAVEPRPLLKAPSPPAPAKRVPPSAPLPPPQVAKNKTEIILAEPPKLQTDAPNVQLADQISKLTTPPLPPPTQPPKIVFENAGQPAPGAKVQGNPQARVTMPNTSVEAVVRDLPKAGSSGTQSVEDSGPDGVGAGPGINLPPSAGHQAESMELKSDPMGVDFRPYMRRILFAIKKNWLAVYPEAARQGLRGETVLQFRIVKQGLVAKVIVSSQSGSKALDEAAIAAISASNPLDPLPRDFKGNQIDLQLNFKYNMPK